MRRHLSLVAALGATLSFATPADAAERWVDRAMTQRRLVFAGDVGLGIGHARFNRGTPLEDTVTGAGMNLEGALGITDDLELGFRTGFRFGRDARAVASTGFGPDYYARTLWTETYGTGADTVANPEFRIRWVAYSGSVAEVGLDGRVFLPVETGTRAGLMFGVPLAFHAGEILRIDTGAYIPIVFQPPGRGGTLNGLSIPGYFWFQPSEKFWIGPMSELRFIDLGPGNHDAHLLLGVGMGFQVASAVDLKWMILSPVVDDHVFDRFGAGFGVQFRLGE